MASLMLRIKEMCAEWLEPFKPNASYSIQKNMKIAMGDFFMSSGYCTELVNLFAKDRINQTARPITKQTNEEVFEACKQEKKNQDKLRNENKHGLYSSFIDTKTPFKRVKISAQKAKSELTLKNILPRKGMIIITYPDKIDKKNYHQVYLERRFNDCLFFDPI